VYTDGGCTKNGDDDARASAGVWFGEDDPRNEAIRLPKELGKPSNQLGEIIGAYRATIVADESEDLAIKSDSRTTLEAVTKHAQKNEDKGWVGVADAKALKTLAASMRERTGKTTLQWVKGHSG
ncbi:ribonuclease H-like protein, partial [Hymenopellis radicata]